MLLSREGFRNHVTVVYSDGTVYKSRNVAAVGLSRADGILTINHHKSETKKLADGVTAHTTTSNVVEIDIGLLAGVEVRHVVDEFANRVELQTNLVFTGRGLMGGVIDNPLIDALECGSVGDVDSATGLTAAEYAEDFVDSMETVYETQRGTN